MLSDLRFLSETSAPENGVSSMTMLEQALAAENVVLSSAGAHAREGWHEIIARKRADIARAGYTVWVVYSNAARPETLRSFCSDHAARYVIFVSRSRDSQPKSGPSTANHASEYYDGKTWHKFSFWPEDPKGISKVTGRINRATAGFWFDALEEIKSGEIELRAYSKLDGEVLDGFQKHEATYPVRRMDAVRRRGYQVLAVGRLARPFAVSLRAERGISVGEGSRVTRDNTNASAPMKSRRSASARLLAKESGVSVSFEDHVAYADPAIRPVLRELRRRIIALDRHGRKIKERVTPQQRVVYSVNRIFAEVKIQRRRILIRFFGMGVPDSRDLVTNIPATHNWQHDKQIAVDSLDLVDYAMPFIEASYSSHLTAMPVR